MSSITPGRQSSGQPTGRPALDPTSLPSHLPSPTAWTNPGSSVRQLEKFECGSDAAEKRAFEMKCQKYFNFSEPSLRPEPLEFVFRYGSFSRAFSITTRQIAMTASIRQDCPLSLPPPHHHDNKYCSTEDLLQPGRLVVHHGLRKSLLSARHSSQSSCSRRCPKLQSHQATCELSFLSRVVTSPVFLVIYLIFL